MSLRINRFLFCATIALVIAFLLIVLLPPARAAPQADAVVQAPCGETQFDTAFNAVQGSGGGIITFNCGVSPAPIVFSSAKTVSANTTIDGANLITLSGGNATRLFVVNGGVALSLNNLTISNGLSSGDDGGAIFNNGTLNINNSKFQNNQASSAWSGGAIVSYGPLNITASEFANNSAGNGGAVYSRFSGAVTNISGSSFHDNHTTNTTNGWGGAMLVWDSAPATITQSRLYSNIALNRGGAIYSEGASSLTIDNSQIYSNSVSASGAYGGGIQSDNILSVTNSSFYLNYGFFAGAISVAGGTANLVLDSFTNNWAAAGGAIEQQGGNLSVNQATFNHNGYSSTGSAYTANGGAIHRGLGGTAFISNTTLSNNWATLGGGIYHYNGNTSLVNVTISGNASFSGGGIELLQGFITATNATISGNTASSSGGGIDAPGGTLTLQNTIAANNLGGNCSGFSGGSFNLSSDNTCSFGAGRDNVNVKLAPLGNYGGPTLTHMPLPGSPAIDNGTDSGCPGIDQRGKPRPIGLACDVGAVERQSGDFGYSLNLPLIVR